MDSLFLCFRGAATTHAMDRNCPICLDAIDDSACVTQCNHTFHSKCILQSVMRNQGCPICRTSLCVRPEPEPEPSISVRAIDLNSHFVEDVEIERRQRNYDARRRRLLHRNPVVKRAKERADAALREYSNMHSEYEDAWDVGIKELAKTDGILTAKRARSLAMRRMRVASNKYAALLHAEIGERPVTHREMRQETLAQAIERLVRARG